MKFNGSKLKVLREARKWDQHRLAEAARSYGTGITQSQISRYENGKEPSGRNAVALAAALDTTVADLYTDDIDLATVTAAAASDDDEDSSMTIGQALDRMLERKVQAEVDRRVDEAIDRILAEQVQS
jgi:transcriptional regulator with XRE-family HTH domain